jgi:hypothetical protein
MTFIKLNQKNKLLKEIFEDTKGAIKRRKSKKDRQYNRKETE